MLSDSVTPDGELWVCEACYDAPPATVNDMECVRWCDENSGKGFRLWSTEPCQVCGNENPAERFRLAVIA